MSTMPAEGSQSPPQEELPAHLADTSTTTSPAAVTKAKTPESQPSVLTINAAGSSSQAHNNSHLKNETSASQGSNSTSKCRVSPTPPTQPAMSSIGAGSHNEHCQGTAHFYRQTVERPLRPLLSGQDVVAATGTTQVNGSATRSALDAQSSEPGSQQCQCGTDRWVTDGGDRSADGPSYQHEDWRVTNGHRRSEALHNGLGPGDDMENYFNANAHMLAYLDLQEGEEDEPPGGIMGGGSRCLRHPDTRRQSSSDSGSHDMRPMSGYSNGYRGDDGLIVNGADGPDSRSGTLVGGRKLSTSSEDLGVFIEADIGLPPLEIDSCDIMRASSSEEDLPQLTSAFARRQFCRGSDSEPDSCGRYNTGSAQRPREGPKLLPPELQPSPGVGPGHQPSSICDYKNGSGSEASRPASFGVANRLCTCSVVSYSRRRPLPPSNQSSSDLDADEGVGGMKASPMEPSPVESEGRAPCGVTVTSDSSSYFSPEDVDFMDFDMATPSDNVGDFAEMGVNISHAEDNDEATITMTCTTTDSDTQPSHHHYHHGERGGEARGSSDSGTPFWVNGDPCEDCGKPEQHCLCASLRTCKRLLEGANSAHQQQVTSAEGHQGMAAEESSHRKRLCSVNSRTDNVQQPGCGCCSESVAGRDSGSGSQEHLDTLSYDEDRDEDDAFENPIPPPHRTCSCSYQGCGRREDTNNLDVEVFSAAPSSDYEDELFNVSRQTSTSNFDQDENAYQDAVEDCASNGFHSACSGSDLESEKSNHIANHHHLEDEEALHSPPVYVREPPSPRPPEIPLPIPARSMDHAPRQPPSLPPFSPGDHPGLVLNGCPDCGGAERPPWLLDDNQLPSPPCMMPHWREYDLPSDRHDTAQRRQRTCAAWVQPDEDDSPSSGISYLEQDLALRDSMGRHNGPGGNLPLREDRTPAGSLAFVTDGGDERTEEDQETTFPDPLPDIFILNLVRDLSLLYRDLREKESRALYATSGTRPAVEKVMIWNEYEAYVLQVKQIGASACGATAIINVLKAFNIYVDKVAASEAIKTNTRAEKAPVAEYLMSRSVAGCTAQHLMEGIEEVTGGEIVGRFFSFYPERDVDICHWLGEWMKKGAVAVLTLNLQRAVPQGWDIPDAWHHQMAYGVGPKGVYLTNPLEIVPEAVIREQLTSDSELLVQRQDIISRWTADTDLQGLLNNPDARWRQFNVIGQVVNVLREARRPRVLGFRPQLTPHIRIPAWYRPGISLFVRRNSDIYEELITAPSLPLRPPTPPEPPLAGTSVNISPGSSQPVASTSTAKQKDEEEQPEPEPELHQEEEEEEEEGYRGSPLLLPEEPGGVVEEGGAAGGHSDSR